MRVNNQNTGNIQNSELGSSRKTEQSGKANSKATEKSEGASTVDTSGSANVELSAKAREMSQASDIASGAPDKADSSAPAAVSQAGGCDDNVIDDHIVIGWRRCELDGLPEPSDTS